MSQYTQGISLYLTNAQYRSQSRPCFRLHACSSRRSRCTAAAPAHHALQGSNHNIVSDGHVTSSDNVLSFPRTNLAPSTSLVVLADAKGQRHTEASQENPVLKELATIKVYAVRNMLRNMLSKAGKLLSSHFCVTIDHSASALCVLIVEW